MNVNASILNEIAGLIVKKVDFKQLLNEYSETFKVYCEESKCNIVYLLEMNRTTVMFKADNILLISIHLTYPGRTYTTEIYNENYNDDYIFCTAKIIKPLKLLLQKICDIEKI